MAPVFLDEADAEFAAGKTMKGSEMLWGAVAHALMPSLYKIDGPTTATAL